jgi:very-short-patch-repair endonuclease
MTLPEVLFWQQLRKRPSGFRFRRQFPIAGYVLDFVCLEQRLAIEIDGQVHALADWPKRDERRDAILLGLGFETLRIAAADALNNLDGALQHVINLCENRPLHHVASRRGPPPRSGEE